MQQILWIGNNSLEHRIDSKLLVLYQLQTIILACRNQFGRAITISQTLVSKDL